MEEITTKKDQSGLRKKVYDFLRDSGFDMPMKVQRELSEILKSVYEKRFTESHQTPQDGEFKHSVVCPKCGDYKPLKSKNAWKGFKRKTPKEFRTNTDAKK